MANEDVIISVIVPSRQREAMLRKSLFTLRDNATHPERVEYWVGIDPDDHVDIPWANVYTAPERYGYARLNEYYNALAARSKGDWLLMWNDDAFMLTQGWDIYIAEQPADRVLCTVVHPDPSEGNVFPVVPASWVKCWSHFSPIPSNDWFVCDTAKEIGNYGPELPIFISHQRVYDRPYLEQDRSFVQNYHTETTRVLRREHAEMIKKLLQSNQ